MGKPETQQQPGWNRTTEVGVEETEVEDGFKVEIGSKVTYYCNKLAIVFPGLLSRFGNFCLLTKSMLLKRRKVPKQGVGISQS